MFEKIFKQKKTGEWLLALLLISLAVASRLIGHPPNFTPLLAVIFFSAVYLKGSQPFYIPLLALFLSDLIIGLYSPLLMAAVYGSFLIGSLIGQQIKKNFAWLNLIIGLLGAGLIFYLLTNFAVWAITPWYPKTIAGLINCYYLALPFYRNALLGDIFYGLALFGSYELMKVFIVKLSSQKLSVKL